ncbi:MAG TPA: cation diffusion facilitator family transporter, partial [Deltaproteobacteria bacterium]|nr:cation diffusion facilitator family transporter [Deltaproteobacteria bacterium]
MDAVNEKVAVARLSIISNSVLILLKITVGLFIGSVSIISEAAHSAVDLIAAIIAFLSVRKSGKPADREHPFGHGKIENISGTVEAILILFAAGWIIFEAVKRFMNPRPLEAAAWGVGVMLVSCIANILVSERLFAVGNKTDSVALKADAWHLRTDVYTSAGVMGGLSLIWLGGWLFPGAALSWIDPMAALAVALLIIHAAWELTVASARDLLDVTLPSEEKKVIKDLIASKRPEVHGFHQLRTRKAGSARFIEFHMLVDPQMSVDDSHRITDEISLLITGTLPHSTVTIHVEPCDGRCDDECRNSCLLSADERALLARKSWVKRSGS